MKKVYLAGKIDHHDWRHDFFDIRSASGEEYDAPIPLEEEKWRTLPQETNGNLLYAGPFFIACDHGCAHGRSNHGRGIYNNGCIPYANSPTTTLERCKFWIKNADYMFVWLNDMTAFGTLAEIGFAHALGKPIFIGIPFEYSYYVDDHEVNEPDFLIKKDMWFALEMADKVVEVNNHKEAWELFKVYYGLN